MRGFAMQAETGPTEGLDGKVTVWVAPGGLQVQMTVTPPLPGGQPVTLPRAMAALARAGVIHGIEEQAVADLIRAQGEVRTAVVAACTPPQQGSDAVIAYHESLVAPGGLPQQREDGTVDFFQLNLVRNVAPGTVLATRTPATPGMAGKSVLGLTIPAPDGREQSLKTGSGAVLSADGLQVSAGIEGHAVLGSDGRIGVMPIYRVGGDVDTATGHIDFVGTVVITGSIRPGFSVRAGQNVEIHGGVDGGSVEAGGDITVRYGILGGHRGRVTAGGRVHCRFAENAEIRCRGDLVVGDGILHSRVRCGGRVLVVGRRGSIIGGQIKAKEEVSSRVLGSSLLALTEIEVGAVPSDRDEMEQVRLQVQEAQAGLKKAQHVVTLLMELEARNPEEFGPERKGVLAKAVRSLQHFREQHAMLEARRQELEHELLSGPPGRVRALEIAHPGVRVTLGPASYHVIDSIEHVCFFLSEQRRVSIGPA